MIEVLLSFFGNLSSSFTNNLANKLFRSVLLVVDFFLLSFFTAFSATQIKTDDYKDIVNSQVKMILSSCIVGTAIVILIQAWACQNFEVEITKSLIDFDQIFSEKLKNQKQSIELSIIARRVFVGILLIASLSLTSVPLIIHGVHGMWEILLFPLILIEVTSFRFVMNVGKLFERFRCLRKKLQQTVEYQNTLESSGKAFTVFQESLRKNLQIEEKFLQLGKCYNAMTSAVFYFNQRFDITVFSIISSAFLSITFCGYNFFIEIETKKSNNVIVGK